MADEFEELFSEWGVGTNGEPIPLIVESYEGSGQMGANYSEPKERPGLVQFPQEKLVRTSTGDERISSTAVYVPLRLETDFPLLSRVTLSSGRVAAILTIDRPDVFGLFGFVVANLE